MTSPVRNVVLVLGALFGGFLAVTGTLGAGLLLVELQLPSSRSVFSSPFRLENMLAALVLSLTLPGGIAIFVRCTRRLSSGPGRETIE